MPGFRYIPLVVAFLYLLTFSEFGFTDAKSTGFSLRLIPRDSPESPVYLGNLTEAESVQRLINFSKARASPVNLQRSKLTNGTSGDRKDVTSIYRDLFYYMAEISIGTPPVTKYLQVDTSGGLIWTQCKPCIECYHQQDDIFDPRLSATYQQLTCDHPLCLDQQSILQCNNGSCVYNLLYTYKGPTKGIASMESFRFPTDDHNSNTSILDNVVFGCSNDNQNFEQFEHNGLISGVLGLNLAPESLFNQLSDHMEKVFSYCIVPFTPMMSAPNIFKFGDDVFIPPGHIPTAPYFTYEGIFNYYLHLNDISIGNQSLELPEGTFDPSSSNIFIDTGTAVTNLVTNTLLGINVYDKVIKTLQQHYDSYHLERILRSDSPLELDLCYKSRSGFQDFPSMTFHFEGGDYVVDGKYVNLNVESLGIFCAAIMPADGSDSILGAIHQQDMRIIHNGNINAIQFYPEDCANDHL